MNAPFFFSRALSSLFVIATLSACSMAPINEVVPQRDGSFSAPTSIQARDYCEKNDKTLRMLGRAPAETGVLFRCN